LGLNASKISEKQVESTGQWNVGVVATALALPGFYGTINEDGSYPSHAGMGYNTSTVWNPMVFLNEYNHPVNKNRMLGNISLKYDILKRLYFNTLFGFDNQDMNDDLFINNIDFYVPASTTAQRSTVNGRGTHNSMSSFSWLSENTVHYDADFTNHHISALLGFTAQKATTDNSAIGANNFPNNLVPTLNAGQVTSGSTTKSEWSMLSLLSRLNYSYKDRYLATLTLRRDGSSRFGRQNRWGYFPSVSAGWIVSEEEFFKNAIVSYLKIKTSYGVSGNNEISNYGSIGLLTSPKDVLGNTIIGGQVPSTVSNENLGWERSKQFNAGIESGFFDDRIHVNAEVYQSINDNLLLNVPVPSITGVTSALQNIGKVRNRGLELNLTTRNIVGNFNWTTEFNISFNRNVVKALGPDETPILGFTYQYNTNITQVGRPIGDFYGYIYEGIYNTEEEISKHPHLSTDVPGDPITKDVNNDGKITIDDRTILGNYQPDFFFGFDNIFKYKGFDMRVFIQGVEGADIMELDYYQSMALTGRTNGLGLARERWRSPQQPGNGKVYSASIDVIGNRRQPSSFYIQDASYIRIKNITLGYNFNYAMLKKVGISNARVYISAQNPFTFTNYIGYNPEVSSYAGSALTPGVNYYGYPLQKTLTLGVNVTF
jgi:TonB-linked SusC/RagA family outer membrane protein